MYEERQNKRISNNVYHLTLWKILDVHDRLQYYDASVYGALTEEQYQDADLAIL
jgi:hypothetical protein